MTQFIRCKICDEKVTEGEQASIVHNKCMCSHKDYEELKEENNNLKGDRNGFQDYYEDMDYKIDRIKSRINSLSKKLIKKELEKFVKEVKEILNK